MGAWGRIMDGVGHSPASQPYVNKDKIVLEYEDVSSNVVSLKILDAHMEGVFVFISSGP